MRALASHRSGLCVRKMSLGSSCGSSDECADNNGLCVSGVCACQPGYQDSANICSKLM